MCVLKVRPAACLPGHFVPLPLGAATAVRFVIVLIGVVAVVRGEQRRTDLLGDLDQLGVRPPLLGKAVVLQLDEQTVAPKDVL